MPEISLFRLAVDRTVGGVSDTSGKTPLDEVFERVDFSSDTAVGEFTKMLSELFPWLVQQGPNHIKLGRQIVRRAKVKDRSLSSLLELLLRQDPTRVDVERRLWISLALMDLGYPRSASSLRRDQELREQHIGEWLSLILANDNFTDVKTSFVEAARDHLISIPQLCLKAEAVRRRFGNRLTEFCKAIIVSFSNENERRDIARALEKMYGSDFSEYVPASVPAGGDDLLYDWLKPKTLQLLNAVEDEANRRAA